jgi:hypothetical protein
MSDQTSIFNENSQVTPEQKQAETPNVQNVESPEDLLKLIKNERGEPKYKSVTDAVKALQASQEYIPNLTKQLKDKDTELANAKAEAARVAELERVVASLTQQQEYTSQPAPKGLTAEDVAQTVSQILERKQAEKTAADNLNATVAAVQGAFGVKADEEFYGRAAALGMSKSEINALAARNPKATLQMLGIEAKKPANIPAGNKETINTEQFKQNQNSFIGRNKASIMEGATSEDVAQAVASANAMVEELEAKGMTMKDLESPKNYFKMFK